MVDYFPAEDFASPVDWVNIHNISRILNECKGGATFYGSFKLDQAFSLADLQKFVENVNIEQLLAGQLGQTSVTVLSTDSKDQILKFIDQLNAMKFDELIARLSVNKEISPY